MKNPVTRAKQFVSDHRTKLATSAGVVVGALGVHAVSHYRGTSITLELPTPQLEALLAQPEGVVEYYDSARRLAVALITEKTPLES